MAKVVTFKPSPPKAGRRAKRQSPLQDALTTHSEDLLMHGRGGTDQPVPPLASDAMKEIRWKGQPEQGQAKGGGKPAFEQWELGKLGSWHPSGPDPNKSKDPTGKGVFSAFDPKGGAGRETGMALPGARDTWRPAHGRRADAPAQVPEGPVWSPPRHAPEGLHALKGAKRAPHPFNLTTDYSDALKEQPSLDERRKRESQLNALRVLRSKMQQSCRMYGRTINDVETMFQAMDTDGSGAIDYDEFTKGLRALDVVFGQKQLAAVLEALDANGDGKVTIIEFLEKCDDNFRGSALGELDAEMHARLGTSAPKAAKKANMTAYGTAGGVFGMTMNLTLAADIALRNRHTKAGGASRFRLEATKLVRFRPNEMYSFIAADVLATCLEQVQPVSPMAAAAIDRIYLFIKKEHLKVIDMFFRIDVDGSGEIEPLEFVQALSKMGLQLSREELDAVVHELDVDGDGTVELHEFM